MSSLRRYLTAPLIFLISLVSGCSVFRPVGNAVSDGYENTVAYFNSYYNASRLFDEAEDEILAAESKRRGTEGFSGRRATPSGAPMNKLNAVIDKCSNILSFQPGSALVDDALLLIGKSYFYQTEFLKSERKFSELISLTPDGPLALEASLWRSKTLLELKDDEGGLPETRLLIQKSLASDEEEIAGEANLILGTFLAKRGDSEEAIAAYGEAVRLSGNDVVKTTAQFRIGEVLMSLGNFSAAADAFFLAGEFADESGLYIASHQMAIKALRASGQIERALEANQNLSDDYRSAGHEKSIAFERASILYERGDQEEAIGLFTMIDTTEGKSALASKAAFELGRIHEAAGDYQRAQGSYARATSFPVPEIFATAREKAGAFSRYLVLKSQRAKRDSLLWSFEGGLTDSLRPKLNPDSLRTLQAVNAYDLAEVFYADLQRPDSAEAWYRTALDGLNDSTRTPRILFILAEFSKDGSEQLYRTIINSFPRSPFAVRAKLKLGLQEESVVDSASFVYRNAEDHIEAGEFQKAISQFKEIARTYPESPFAAKGAYAIGWIYEYRLHQPDTALSYYRSLVEHFGTSPYARVVRRKIQEAGVPSDSTEVGPKEADERRMEEKLRERSKRDTKVIIE